MEHTTAQKEKHVKRSVVVALRHIERDKSNKENPQTPTHGGELQAFAMGTILRREFGFVPDDVVSSPQGRAVSTAKLVLASYCTASDGGLGLKIKTDSRLDDFSSDKRLEIVAAMDMAQEYSKKLGLEVEQAMFATEVGLRGIALKVSEALPVVIELFGRPGNHLIAGLHGCTIDAMYSTLVGGGAPMSPGAAGGIFDKVEGFYAVFEGGDLTDLKVIRQPPWLKALGQFVK